MIIFLFMYTSIVGKLEEDTEDIIERNYIIESRPVENRKWQQLRVLSCLELLYGLKEKEREALHE